MTYREYQLDRLEEVLKTFDKKYIYSDGIIGVEALSALARSASNNYVGDGNPEDYLNDETLTGELDIELDDLFCLVECAANAHERSLLKNSGADVTFMKLLDVALQVMKVHCGDWSKAQNRIYTNRGYMATKLSAAQDALMAAQAEAKELIDARDALIKKASESGWSFGQLADALGVTRSLLHRIANR